MNKLQTILISGISMLMLLVIGCGSNGTGSSSNSSGTSTLESSASTSSHNAGQACSTGAGCHGGSGPSFTIAGTLYDDNIGSNTVTGTSVSVPGIGAVVSDLNGNFYSNDSAYTGAVANVDAPGGAMTTVVDFNGTGGNCQQAGTCHGGAEPKVY